LGSTGAKAAHRMLMKLTPGRERKKDDTTFCPLFRWLFKNLRINEKRSNENTFQINSRQDRNLEAEN